jgi:hypothetical protein
MSNKYVLNQFGKLSKSQYKYATKKFNKYTTNLKLNPNIKNSLITPFSSKTKDELLKSLSKKKQIKSILKKNLLSNKNLSIINHNKILKNMTQKGRSSKGSFIPLLRFN